MFKIYYLLHTKCMACLKNLYSLSLIILPKLKTCIIQLSFNLFG